MYYIIVFFFDKSNAMGNITQIPLWDENTWVEGKKS